jgi:hypothetical protein
MSFNYINGYNVSKIDVYLNKQLIETLTFPLENVEGKKESIQDKITTHNLLVNGEIVQEFQGTRITWSIPFEEWASLNVMIIMKKLRDYRRLNQGHIFILTPHLEIPERFFDVLLYNESINLGIERATENAPFNTGVTFGFITRYYVNENWKDKNYIPIIGLRDFNRIGIFKT